MNDCNLIVWLITGKCDLKCRHCYASRFYGFEELSTEEAIKVIKGLLEINANHISFTGGEPTLRKDLPILISEAYDYGFELSIVTNALTLNSNLMRLFARKEVEVQTSIDGATEETFTKIRGPYFKLLLEKLKKLKAFGANIRPIMTINTLNYHEAAEYVKLCHDMGAVGAAIIPLIPIGRADASLLPTPTMVKNAVIAVDRVAEELKFDVEVWCAPHLLAIVKTRRVTICPCMIREALDIAPDGSVMICDSLNIKVCNIRDGVKESWERYLNHEFVKRLSVPKSLNDICKDCKYVDACLGGCHARANAMYNDPSMPDPLCPLIKPIQKHH